MSRRIDIELTSKRDDSSWTWRAVGAREPKGVIDAGLLPAEAKVGDELRVEVEFFVDGSEIIAVLPPKAARKEPEKLEVLGSGRDPGGVTTSLVSKGGRGRGDRDREGGRGRGRGDRDGGRGKGGPPRGKGQGRGAGGRGRDRDRADRPPRQERPAPPAKPKPKRLRPQRTHRSAVLASLPEEQRPIAEQVLRGGMPAVRKAVEDQNARNKSEGRPEIAPAPLLQLAESILPGLKEAEWHDRADAALAGIGEVDLRDLRSVVVAAESNARSEETRALADQLRTAVAERVDTEHNTWLAEIAEALDDERTVRALRMSSRPPKAGAPLPPDLSNRLVEAANAALSDDTGPQRWGTVLDAVAYSPIRTAVTPAGVPARPNDELLETVKRLSTRVPEIAALFGIEPQKAPRKRRKPRSGGRGRGGKDAAPKSDTAKADTPKAGTPKAGTSKSDTAKADTPRAGGGTKAKDAPKPEEAAPAEEPVAEEAAPAAEPVAEEAAPAEERAAAEEAAPAEEPVAEEVAPAEEAAPAEEPVAEEAAPAEEPAAAEEAAPAEEPVEPPAASDEEE